MTLRLTKVNKTMSIEKPRIEKTYWYDDGLHKTYGHNNQGLIYGINYIDDDIISNCEWFKTKTERNNKYKKYNKDKTNIKK